MVEIGELDFAYSVSVRTDYFVQSSTECGGKANDAYKS